MNACFIFGALDCNAVSTVPQDGDFIIAADKGLLSVQQLGFKADLIIGDFDSLGFVPQKNGKIIKLPVRKDDTDVGFALKTAFDMGYRRFYLYGVLGGKLSHTVANLQLAADYSKKGADITLYGENTEAAVITNKSVSLKNRKGDFSVFSLDEISNGVSIIGAEYEVSNATLKNTFPLGVSNRFKGEQTDLSVVNGTLAIIIEC